MNSKDYVGTVECEEGKVGFGIAMTLWLNDDAGSEIAITSRKKLTQLLSCDENLSFFANFLLILIFSYIKTVQYSNIRCPLPG